MREIQPVTASNRPGDTPEPAPERVDGPPGSVVTLDRRRRPEPQPGIVLRVRQHKFSRYFQLFEGAPPQLFDETWLWPGAVEPVIEVLECTDDKALVPIGDIQVPGPATPWVSLQDVSARWSAGELVVSMRDAGTGDEAQHKLRW